MTITTQPPVVRPRRPRLKGPLWWFWQVLSWLVLLIALAWLLATIVVPRLSGAQAYTVLTGSMEPRYPPGTLVVVKTVDPADLAIGDVVTYQIKSGEPAVVTHRIVAVSATTGGELRFVTQGDANNAPDSESVRPVQIRGELWYSVPFAGYLNSAISGEAHIWLLWIAVALLLGYAAFMLVSAALDRKRRVSP
ncbi:signal peptidase I [Psychromicrobium sp. YIM B11713]|uniref:signal peptidase I n=1 Tax=Psychromicrobium sp. YIM B11713 TaxID=3145233 RepID=UPI00374FBC2A